MTGAEIATRRLAAIRDIVKVDEQHPATVVSFLLEQIDERDRGRAQMNSRR